MDNIKNLASAYDQLSFEDLIWITDHVFGNLFVCNGNGKILYLNQNAADTFGMTKEQTLKMNTYDIVGNKIISRSTTIEALENKEPVIGNFMTQSGQEYFAISTPMFDENGNVSLVMTYSQEQSLMTTFFDAIERERKLAIKYKHAYNHIINYGNNKKSVVVSSKKMRDLFDYAERISKTDGTVIILGESGTGKDIMANYIHSNSFRKEEPLIPVNCSAIPENLMESEFFGYEQGAFTGAKKEGKPGLFELANRGTLFLDEIAELPPAMQSKLLRVLESGEIYHVGGTRPIQTNVRLIVATNRNLEEMVHQNKFREDLYYRLNVVPILIPALRERRDDIMPLANFFLSELNKKYSYQRLFDTNVQQKFEQYNWPGNVRELRNLIERMVITSTTDILTMDNLNLPRSSDSDDDTVKEDISEATSEVSKMRTESTVTQPFKKLVQEKVIETLLETNGNKSKAAKLLGMSIGKLNRILPKNYE